MAKQQEVKIAEPTEGSPQDVDTSREAPKPDLIPVNDRPESLDEALDVFHTSGGWYELPTGEKVHGKRRAKALLRAYFDESPPSTADNAVTYRCIQHPELIVFGQGGTPIGQFRNGTLTVPDDIDGDPDRAIATLDATPYVIRER